MFLFPGQRQEPDQDPGHRPEVASTNTARTQRPQEANREEQDEEMSEPAGGRRRRDTKDGGTMNYTDG